MATSMFASVPGAVVAFPRSNGMFSGMFGGASAYSGCIGYVTLKADSWDRLQSGTQSLLITFTGLDDGYAANPTLIPRSIAGEIGRC